MTHETKHLCKYETEIGYRKYETEIGYRSCFRIRPYQYNERYMAYEEHFHLLGIDHKRISVCWYTLSINLEILEVYNYKRN